MQVSCPVKLPSPGLISFFTGSISPTVPDTSVEKGPLFAFHSYLTSSINHSAKMLLLRELPNANQNFVQVVGKADRKKNKYNCTDCNS